MKKLFFSLLLLANCSLLTAQSSIGVDTAGTLIPTNVYFNNLYTFKVGLLNYGPQNYTGPIQIEYWVDTTASGGPLAFFSYDSLTNATILTGSTYHESSSKSIAPGYFRSGINTVVIWPRSTSVPFTTHDSLKINILVIGYSNIENYTLGKLILFPNPAQHLLQVANNNPNFVIEQVRIYDVLGQPVYAESFKGFLDVSKLTSGAYTLEFSDKKGRVSRYKVIKE